MNSKASEPWIRIRYRILLQEFGDKEFTRKDVEKIFEKYNKQLANINEFLNILSKEGLLESREVNNKYFYKLKEIPLNKNSTTKDQIIKILKMGADLIRVRVDYKILLVLLFYKALSDKWKEKAEEYLSEIKDKEEAYHLTNIDYYVLYDESSNILYTWEEVTKDKINLIPNFITALNKVSELNEKLSDLKILVEKLGLAGFLNNEDNYHIFLDLVDLFNNIDLSKMDYDIVGSSYEWILSYFAPVQAKEGENYTPREVIRLMIEILDIKENSDVLDPAVGSAAMLIEAYKYASENYNDGKTLKLEGQEINDVTVILAKLNLLLHGAENYEIYVGDSLINPKFAEADYVLANPPWNQDGYDESKVSREDLKIIYKYGFVPKQSADWLWVQLMFHYARKKVAVILDNGALFRGGKEKKVRENMIEKDLIECIILLPEKLFYNTGAPGIIMILNKNKPEERKRKILFINASNEFEKHPEVRKLNILSRKNIDKIVEAYREFKNIEGFCKTVSLEEIKENDYNLNVTLYVFPLEEEEKIDVKKEWEELKNVDERLVEINRKIEKFVYGSY